MKRNTSLAYVRRQLKQLFVSRKMKMKYLNLLKKALITY
ncbi:hypothetical protein BMETH_3441_0 [methanotrophic bacterial endosymbiont of Bathymodiolus sp.]|nr:hypothetical protein BMETH_3441_0 [methanotrophic bacterial endosymbiont of Bathymodiolus sp.]